MMLWARSTQLAQMYTSLGPSTMGPTSREDFPQKEQVVTRLPRNPPGGLFALPWLIGGTFGGPPPLPVRLEVAILSCLPQQRELIRSGEPWNFSHPRMLATSQFGGSDIRARHPDYMAR